MKVCYYGSRVKLSSHSGVYYNTLKYLTTLTLESNFKVYAELAT